MTSPVSPLKSQTASNCRSTGARIRELTAEGSTASDASPRDVALLLDLSGDRLGAGEWADQNLTEPEIWLINKADLKWESRLKALDRLRGVKHHTFAVFTKDITAQSMRGAMMLFAALAGSGFVVFGDASGKTLRRTRAAVLLIEGPRLLFEMAFGYGVLVPLTLLITLLLDVAQIFREVSRAHLNKRDASQTMLYLRATLSNATEGGMVTHSSGFASGARSLGHKLRFVISGRASPDEYQTVFVEPSVAVSATRALFELWNNLVFTAKSLGARSDEIDLIYQRYSRFNWSGVVLSLVTGRPFLLEFNGSEVWVSKRWDPVGLLWLLRLFERLNLKAADLVFVVSEVERRNLISNGVNPAKIVVNPNGVDTEKFRPGCGGKQVRLSLGLDDRIIVGFLGTFGPWHGAPVLADTVKQVRAETGCHFLFIGDGDERATAEAIIESSGNRNRATFTGRVPHEDAPRYLDACDILVSPHVSSGDGSEFFGSPTKLFEYMALARPVIASRLGQIADVIEDGENGLLVEPGDSRAIARSIEMLSKDEPLRKKLGEAARQTVIDGYMWRHNAERVFDSAFEVM